MVKARSSSPNKFKLIKLPNGIQYIGRLNKSLSLKEIWSNLTNLEDARILTSNDVVKLSLKAKAPTARDYFLKFIYDKIRNKRKFGNYTTIPEANGLSNEKSKIIHMSFIVLQVKFEHSRIDSESENS